MLQKKTEQLLSQATPEQLGEIKWLLEHPEYEERPVDIETFVNHPQYLGLSFTVKGNKGYGCRPRILNRLKEIFDPEKRYEEFVLACGIGWGKDFTSSIVLCYQLYRLACLKDPQSFYGFSGGSAIYLMLMSINETHARDVLFGEVRARIDNSDWFERNFRYNNKINSELQFLSKNIYLIPGNSRETTFIGYNIFTAIIDEGDDYLVTESRDDAAEGYNAIKDRIISRFRDKGMLGIIGSPKRIDGFIMRSYRNEEGVPSRYRLLVPTWDSLLDTPLLCGKTFKIKGLVVPVEYQLRFKSDPDRALRDLGARPFLAKQPFITLTERIDEIFTRKDLLFLKKDDKVESFSGFVPGIKGDESVEYFCHIDLAVNRKRGDRLGFAIGHIAGWKDIDNEEKPIMEFDIAMVITAPSGGEIMLADVKQMIFFLRDRGFNFTKLTMDSWNSVGMLQSFKGSDIPGEVLSVDKTTEPYEVLKEAIYEKRVLCHEYKLLKDELGRLELINGEKVEHPPDGCFTGDTRVALLDGTNPTFKELAERFSNGEEFDVYSMSKDGICVGKARNSRVTIEDAELIEVTLDNYQVIRCTFNHLFMTVDGEWIKAENLTKDVGIMPLYRNSAYAGGWSRYEKVWCPIRRKRLFTHQMCAEQFFGKIPFDYIVHHIDENKSNNSSFNLQVVLKKLHASNHTKKRHKTDSFYVEKLREGHKKYRENGGNEKSRQNMLSLIERGIIKKGRDVCSIEECNRLNNAKGMCDVHYQRMRRLRLKVLRSSSKINHRILSVKRLFEKENVWDITVDKFHNFALSSGVFVHNSKDCADAICGIVFSISKSNSSRILSFSPGFGGKREFKYQT